MFRAAVSGVQRTGLSVVPLGRGPLAQVSVGLAERQPQPGLGQWLVREPGRQHRSGRVQRLTEGDVLVPTRPAVRPAGRRRTPCPRRTGAPPPSPPPWSRPAPWACSASARFRSARTSPTVVPATPAASTAATAPPASNSARRRFACSAAWTSAGPPPARPACARSSAARRKAATSPATASAVGRPVRRLERQAPLAQGDHLRVRPAGVQPGEGLGSPAADRVHAAPPRRPSPRRAACRSGARTGSPPGRTRPPRASILSSVPGRLLGGHVRRRAQHAAGLRQCAVGVSQRADLGRVGGSPQGRPPGSLALAGSPPGPWPAPSP